MNEAFENLTTLQTDMYSLISTLQEEEITQQYHPDLSPMGWHLGHCVYTDHYWVQEKFNHQPKLKMPPNMHNLFHPEYSVKKERGNQLPNKNELLEWSNEHQKCNLKTLEQTNPQHTPILDISYILNFLSQHYMQHHETIHMILQQKKLANKIIPLTPKITLQATQPSTNVISYSNLNGLIGGTHYHQLYDNEYPAHHVDLKPFALAKHPVSNAEFLSFIEQDGYQNPQYWSTEGWQWRQKNQINAPNHWRLNKQKQWFGVDIKESFELISNLAVYGLSHYEATAFARFANARLPHEYEWELAANQNPLMQQGQVWEWCANTFHPYKGFRAFPYDDYSLPYFGQHHFVLKGGSQWTIDLIKRPSFRNYYTADKRHIFAGLRLAYDL